MKIGISTASLFLKTETENAFETLQNLGVNTTEVFLSTYFEYGKQFITDLAKGQNGINVHSVHALPTQFEPQLFSRQHRVRADAEKIFEDVLTAGQILGAKYYTFHGPGASSKSPSLINMNTFSDRMNELCCIAEKYGITLCYENVHYCMYKKPDFFKELSANCLKLGMCLDIKHAQFSGYDPLDYLDVAGDRLHTVHVTDLLPNEKTALPGMGDYDFGKLFKNIQMRGLDPAILIEVYDKDFVSFDELGRSCDYLKNVLKNI